MAQPLTSQSVPGKPEQGELLQRRRPYPRRRLHEEILAPPQKEASPRVKAQARRALAILVLGAILLQPVAALVGPWLNHQIGQGDEVSTQWAAYVSKPAPDVLFVGASEARADVDTGRLAAALTEATGRRITVGKIGALGMGPGFIDLLVYQILHRASRPRMIVQTVEPPMFNGSPTLDCNSCWTDSETSDIWQISDLTDPGFIELALRNDPNRIPLVSGWVLPAVSAYQFLPALGCPVTAVERAVSLRLTGRLPVRLQPGSSPCDHANSVQPDLTMTPQRRAAAVAVYQKFLMADYQISPDAVAQERELVRRARAAGTEFIFLRPPFHSALRDLDGSAGKVFQGQLAALSSELGVPLLDLSRTIPDNPNLWVDPYHLNGRGSSELASHLEPALMRFVDPGT